MQYVAMLWTEKKGKLLQAFGPYQTHRIAEQATEKLSEWPAFRSGTWEIIEVYPDPPETHTAPIIPYVPSYTYNTVYTYPQTFTYSGLTSSALTVQQLPR